MNNIVCGEMKIGIVSPADKKYANKGLSGSYQTVPCLLFGADICDVGSCA